MIYRFFISSVPITNRGEVTNSLPSFYLAAPGPAANSSIRPGQGLSMGGQPYMVPNPHHQPLGPAFSLQPYAAYPHGVIYQPVVVPPMLFQPGMGMMMSTSQTMTQQQQHTSHNRSSHIHHVIFSFKSMFFIGLMSFHFYQ